MQGNSDETKANSIWPQKSDDRLAKKYEFGIPSPEMTSLFFNETLHLMTHLHYFSFEFPPLPFCPLNTGSDDSFEVDENSIIYIMIEKFE